MNANDIRKMTEKANNNHEKFIETVYEQLTENIINKKIMKLSQKGKTSYTLKISHKDYDLDYLTNFIYTYFGFDTERIGKNKILIDWSKPHQSIKEKYGKGAF